MGNLARKSLLEAGLDFKIPGITIDRQCGSGLEAVIYKPVGMVQSGAGTIYIAGGVESTSEAPWKNQTSTSQFMNLSFTILNGRLLQEKEKTLQ